MMMPYSNISSGKHQQSSVGYPGGMSYLDNLENSLKALEAREQFDPEQQAREAQKRERDRDAAAKRAPHARALNASAFTGQLLGACRKLGPSLGIYVQITWVDDGLRLEARDSRLELVPTAEGIEGVYSRNGEELRRELIDLEGDGEALAKNWLESIPATE
jgi:hypothetical protein